MTVRRDVTEIVVIIWSNADVELVQAWKSITWAVAELTGGLVQTAGGPQSAAEFRKGGALPPSMQIDMGAPATCAMELTMKKDVAPPRSYWLNKGWHGTRMMWQVQVPRTHYHLQNSHYSQTPATDSVLRIVRINRSGFRASEMR